VRGGRVVTIHTFADILKNASKKHLANSATMQTCMHGFEKTLNRDGALAGKKYKQGIMLLHIKYDR
jgi:methanogenic corrinoid protein MtbC1